MEVMKKEGMKESRLRELIVCSKCNKKLGKTSIPFLFHTIKVKRWDLDSDAIRRQQGLGMMLGGYGLLASVMGPNEDMAKKISETKEFMICEDCSIKPLVLAHLVEQNAYKNEDNEN